MTATFVQTVAAGLASSGNDVAMSVVNVPTVGNTLIVGAMFGFNSSSGSCSDSKGNTYGLDEYRAGGGVAAGQYRTKVTSALTTSDHITAHSNGLGTTQCAMVLEFANFDSTPVDRVNLANINNVNNISIALGGNSAQANEMMVATAAIQTTSPTSWSATSGWSFVAPALAPWNISGHLGIMAWQLFSSVSNPTVNLGNNGTAGSNTLNAVIAAYKSAPAVTNPFDMVV